MVGEVHRFERLDPAAGEQAEKSVRAGGRRREPHAFLAERFEWLRCPAEQHAADIDRDLERVGGGAPIERGERVTDGDHEVGVGTERGPGSAEITPRWADPASQRGLAIDGEEREVSARRRELQWAVEDEHVRVCGGEVDGGLPRASHDDVSFTETHCGLEGLVARAAYVVVGPDEASAPHRRAMPVPHVDRAYAPRQQARGARDGERRLAGAAEGCATHAEHAHARGHTERPREPHEAGPEPRQRIPRRCPHAALETRGQSADRAIQHTCTLRYCSEPMLDLFALADRQLEGDAQRTRRLRGLYEHKLERMRQSPLAFLRGAAPLFYELIEQDRALGEGPDGDGWIVGDLHVENFGAYRPSERDGKHSAKKDDVTFDVNDFDDCAVGPRRLDVLRLTTSLLLAAPLLGFRGVPALELADALVDTYAEHAKSARPLPKQPGTVTALLRQVALRTKQRLLDDRTSVTKGERHFLRGPRYRDLPADVARAVPEAFATYLRSLASDPKADELTIVDAAFRVAGTGSLGKLRVAILTRGKGGLNGHWIFDMKEQGAPACARLLRLPKMNGAERVAAGLRACLAKPPPLLGTTRIVSLPMIVRRLAPQEDKLSLAHLAAPELLAVVRYLGAVLGRVHRRGASTKRAPSWNRADRAHIVANAVRMAGLHEGIFLALCERSRARSPA